MVGIVFLFSSIIFLLQHCRSVIPVLHQNSEETTVMYEFSDDRIVLTVLFCLECYGCFCVILNTLQKLNDLEWVCVVQCLCFLCWVLFIIVGLSFFLLSQDVVILFTLMSLNVPRVSFDKESYSTILPNSTHVLRHNAINRNRK